MTPQESKMNIIELRKQQTQSFLMSPYGKIEDSISPIYNSKKFS